MTTTTTSDPKVKELVVGRGMTPHVCLLVVRFGGRSVCPNFLKGREVTLLPDCSLDDDWHRG